MTEKETKNVNYGDLTPAERRRQEKEDRLDEVLASIRPDWVCEIYRTAPTWCGGHIDRYEIGDIDDGYEVVEYIKQTFGGKKFLLKFRDPLGKFRNQVTLNLSAFPPKMYGRIVNNDQWGYPFDDQNHSAPSAPQPAQPIIQQQPIQPQSIISPLANVLETLSKTRREDLQLLSALTQNTPTQPAAVGNSMSQLLEFAEVFQTLRDTFGGADQIVKNDTNNEVQLFSLIGDVVKTLAATKEPARRHTSPATVVHTPPSPPPSQSPATPATPANQAQQKTDRALDDTLSNLPPEKAAEMCFSALGKMSEADRETAMEYFLSRLQNLQIVDSNLQIVDSDEIDDDQEENDNETNSSYESHTDPR